MGSLKRDELNFRLFAFNLRISFFQIYFQTFVSVVREAKQKEKKMFKMAEVDDEKFLRKIIYTNLLSYIVLIIS